MRLLTFAILCITALILAGIVTVTMTGNQSVDVHFNSQKATQDFNSILDAGRSAVHKVEGD